MDADRRYAVGDGLHDLDWRHDDAADGADAGGLPLGAHLVYGGIYAIVTRNDLRTVKRLGPGSTPDTFTLIPTNKSPEYVAQEIDKADILHVYQVIGCMKKF